MPGSQLKRAERAIQAIRDQSELPPEAADALTELVDAVRYIEVRLSALEGKSLTRRVLLARDPCPKTKAATFRLRLLLLPLHVPYISFTPSTNAFSLRDRDG